MMGLGCYGMGWGGWSRWGGMGPLGHILGLAFWIALLALLVIGVIWLAQRFRREPRAVMAGEAPLEAVRRRLAAGEITPGEYDEILHGLRSETRAVER